MTGRTRFVVQGFEHVGGRLTATTRSLAQSEGHALRQAQAEARRLSGAAAIKLTAADGAPVGTEQVTILGAFGDVPDALADGLAGG